MWKSWGLKFILHLGNLYFLHLYYDINTWHLQLLTKQHDIEANSTSKIVCGVELSIIGVTYLSYKGFPQGVIHLSIYVDLDLDRNRQDKTTYTPSWDPCDQCVCLTNFIWHSISNLKCHRCFKNKNECQLTYTFLFLKSPHDIFKNFKIQLWFVSNNYLPCVSIL